MNCTWVYSLIGDPLASEHGIPYIQLICPGYSNLRMRAEAEAEAHREYFANYPGHPVVQARWDCVETSEGQ